MSTKASIPQLNLYTVDQVAEMLQCSVSLVEDFIKAGRLRRVPLTNREVGPGRPGRKNWRVRPEALAAFIQSLDGVEPQKPKEGEAVAATATTPAASGRSTIPLSTGTDGKRRLRSPK